MIDLRLGDCIDILKTLPDNSVDSIVTDPPYHLTSTKGDKKGFMGKDWDGGDIAFRTDVWEECLRVLKPGGHLLSFGGSRTYHRMAVAIEDAGFEIRDQIMWIYGQGFPKSHNIGKAIDKIEGNQREVGKSKGTFVSSGGQLNGENTRTERFITKGNSDYEGWGSSLKPAHEPICMARKPLSEKSIAENVLKHGTGGINIDGSRIGYSIEDKDNINFDRPRLREGSFDESYNGDWSFKNPDVKEYNTEGRFPANIMFECICDELIDGKEIKGNENYNWNNTDTESNTFTNRGTYTPRTETPKIHTNPNCPCYMLDQQSGIKEYNKGRKEGNYKGGHRKEYVGTIDNDIEKKVEGQFFSDKGGASRFFYCPKVSKKERDMNMNGEEKPTRKWRDDKGMKLTGSGNPRNETGKNTHPTVKPIALMEYLIKLVTPKGGVVLEPFMGSGSTGIAAKNLGMSFIGIEREQEYFDIATQRIGE
jgi:site-specific DNA-methyltransferase (adenine-specific)